MKSGNLPFLVPVNHNPIDIVRSLSVPLNVVLHSYYIKTFFIFMNVYFNSIINIHHVPEVTRFQYFWG